LPSGSRSAIKVSPSPFHNRYRNRFEVLHGLFGWRLAPGETGYLHIRNGEEFIGGIPGVEHRDPNIPPHWLLYFQTDDCAASAQKARELGANILSGPLNMENVGRFATVADPQGAVFALFQPK
jgi:predicted enzyme related to lactoylglutathione lyase